MRVKKIQTISAVMMVALDACATTANTSSTELSVNQADTSPSWATALGSTIDARYSGAEHRAFDFWIGEWEANWRGKPQGEFYHQKEGSYTHQRVFPILGGKALVELAWDSSTPNEAGQRGFSIRYFDTQKQRWIMAQNWPNANNQGSAFSDQLIGDEHLGRLTMYSVVRRPNAEGEITTAHRRYNFTDIRPGQSFRWDGSNSNDVGATWFTWNIVDFLRERDVDAFGAAGTTFPGVHEKNLCTDDPHGAFNQLEGNWAGTVIDASGVATPVTLSAGLALDGCGVLAALNGEAKRQFMTIGYHPRANKWLIYALDDQPGTPHQYFVADAPSDDEASMKMGITFDHAPNLTIKDEFTAFNAPAYFAPTTHLTRIVFESFERDALVFRKDVRTDADTPWTVTARYQLQRQ